MAEGSWTGILILLGIVVIALVIAVLGRNATDAGGEEHDIEHLDHETRGDEYGA